MPLDFNELRQLLLTIAQTDIAELTLKSDDFELTVRKAVGMSNALPSAILPSGVVGSESMPATPPTSTTLVNGLDAPRGAETASSGFVTGQASTPAPKDQKFVEVISPMVGTFYRAPAPGEPSFVEVGDRVRSGQTVCIIEAMKLMDK